MAWLSTLRGTERVGFEPTVPVRVHTLSKRAPSTTRSSLPAHTCPERGGFEPPVPVLRVQLLSREPDSTTLAPLPRTYLFSCGPFPEREGFEPPEPCGSTVFKTASFDHSDTSPVVHPPGQSTCQDGSTIPIGAAPVNRRGLRRPAGRPAHRPVDRPA